VTVFEFTARDLGGTDRPLGEWRGRVLLIVNVASKCGLTPQYAGLEELYARHKERGLVVLGFPCDQFGQQEPGDEAAIRDFCQVNYGVTFPMFAKIDVNGPDAHPLYRHLRQARTGLLGSTAIKWNFTKFLVGRDGAVLQRYAPTATPAQLEKDIVPLLDSADSRDLLACRLQPDPCPERP
jgi:glutathione peroxidase